MLNVEPPRSVDQFCRDVTAIAEREGRSKALEMVLDLVHFTIASEHTITKVLSSRQLDHLCLHLGRTTTAVESFDPDQTVYVVTFLSKSGGHSRVLADLIKADPGRKTTILVTNVMHEANEAELRGALGEDVDLHVAPAKAPLEDVLIWAQDWLATLRAERVYLLQHHFDPVIPAAVQPALVKRLFYIHNCDHSLTLGVHIPHATHVDLHGKGFHNCRDREGVADNVCWPLVSQPGPTRSLDGREHGPLRTATSGGEEKFGSNHLIERVPYLLRYPDMVVAILKATNGTHHHIGGLSKSTLAEIGGRLEENGLEQSRFVHVSFVPRLATYFVENDIDLYVGSMPWGGGRALVEVMGTGLPVLLYYNYVSQFLTDQSEAYPEAMTWRTLDDLAMRLKAFDPATLERHARASLALYQARHRPEALQAAIAATLRGEPGILPERPVYHPDALQRFLDERAALKGQLQVSASMLRERDDHMRELEHAYRTAETLARERLTSVEALDQRLILLEHAYRMTEQLAVDRLAEVEALDQRLIMTDKALANVTQLAMDRLAEIEASHAQQQSRDTVSSPRVGVPD